MNYNVKRFTRPIKGICDCNYEAIKSISNLASNNFEYRQYNKQFFMKRLGDIMEHTHYSDNCEMIEPVIAGQELAKLFVNGVNGNAGQRIALNTTDERIDQGMLIITTESTSNAVKNVTLVYPREYSNGGNVSRTLNDDDYRNIFTTVPLTTVALKAMYNHAIEKYNNGDWKGVMSFDDGLSRPIYDYKLYVYLFPDWA